jgi:nitrile hydratase
MGGTGTWNLDMGRSARETLPDYSKLTYYEIWLAGLEKMLLERGLVKRQEVDAGRMLTPALPVPRVLHAGDVAAALAKGAPTLRNIPGTARFSVGDCVRTRSTKVDHHTRLPGYALGKLGHIEHVHGAHVFPDTNAQGDGEQPQWLYTVVFEAVELWGPDADEHHRVSIDAWEAYLEGA